MTSASTTTTGHERLRFVLASLIPAGWLVPNHYPPWTAAHSDAVSIVFLLMLGLVAPAGRLPRLLGWFVALSLIVIGAQATTGLIAYRGDALMAVLYLLLFGLAVSIGGAPIGTAGPLRDPVWLGLLTGMFIAAVLSVFVAVVQWTQVWSLGIYAPDLPPTSRPFGNVAQANHLTTIAALGLCALLDFHRRGIVGRIGLAVAGCWLLIGIALAQSRMAWVFVLFASFATALAARRGRLERMSPWLMVAAASIAGVVVVIVHRLADLLLLTLGRVDQAVQMNRLGYWRSMLDAIIERPWFGYGWQQTSFAQYRVTLNHPPLFEAFDQSHNLVLDLLIWNGIPIGVMLAGLLVYWVLRQMVNWTSATGWFAWLMASLLLIHSLVEYPLQYAYFLIPLGLAMGAAQRESILSPCVDWSRRTIRFVSALLAMGSILVGLEYARIESDYRLVRFAAARIGDVTTAPEVSRIRLLTQLTPLMTVSRLSPRAGMSSAELVELRLIAMRYPYVTHGLDLAVAAGLNNRPDEAAEELQRQCMVHDPRACRSLGRGWRAQVAMYPVLRAVALPKGVDFGSD